ncbi:MAG TPA: hypothetical protein VFK41_06360 [Nocardioidaceae bacterium]|nr:hypothetical protein [Nocardioidaceae bacterium]
MPDPLELIALVLATPFALYFALRRRKEAREIEAATRGPADVRPGDVVVVITTEAERIGVVESWEVSRYRRQARIRYTTEEGEQVSDLFDVSDFRLS